MEKRIIAFVILLIMPALAMAGQNHNCRAIFKGYGVTQQDCGKTGTINTITINGVQSTSKEKNKGIYNSHIFIAETLVEAEWLSRNFHKPDGGKCSDHFYIKAQPLAAPLLMPIDSKSCMRRSLKSFRKWLW